MLSGLRSFFSSLRGRHDHDRRSPKLPKRTTTAPATNVPAAGLPAGGGSAGGVIKQMQYVDESRFEPVDPVKVSLRLEKLQQARTTPSRGLTQFQRELEGGSEDDGLGVALTAAEREVLLTALRKVKIFLGLSQNQQQSCIDTMERIDLYAHELVALKGELSDYVFVILEGEVIGSDGPDKMTNRRYGPGEAFGVWPLLYNAQQQCTFKTVQPSQIWRLERMRYRRISARNEDNCSLFSRKWYQRMACWENLEYKFKTIASKKGNQQETMSLNELRLFLNGVLAAPAESDDTPAARRPSQNESQNVILDLLMDALDTDKSGDVDLAELRTSYHTWFGAALKPVRALIVIDVQNDFIDGTLRLKDCPAGQDGARVVPVINRMRTEVNFDCVAISLDWHPHRHCSFHESCIEGDFLAPLHPSQSKEAALSAPTFGSVVFVAPDGKTEMKQTLWPRHCVQHSWGAECHPELMLTDDDVIVHKGTNARIDSYSCVYDNGKYQKTTMLDELRSRGVTHVYLCGLALDVCVTFSALHMAEEGFVTTVVLDACAGVSDEGIAEKKTIMSKAGVQLVRSEEVPALVMRPPVIEAVHGALNTSIAKELVHAVENETGHGGKESEATRLSSQKRH